MENYAYVDEYLPIGAIIIVRGNVKKIAIVSRGVVASIEGRQYVFDYAGVMYPEGVVNKQYIYFNHEDIAKIVSPGYSDEDDALMKENIKAWLCEINVPKGDVQALIRQQANALHADKRKGDGYGISSIL